MTWASVAPAVSAAFLASLVEAVEAVTIVLAVATVRGWRSAGSGALAGLAALALLVLTVGPLLELRIRPLILAAGHGKVVWERVDRMLEEVGDVECHLQKIERVTVSGNTPETRS